MACLVSLGFASAGLALCLTPRPFWDELPVAVLDVHVVDGHAQVRHFMRLTDPFSCDLRWPSPLGFTDRQGHVRSTPTLPPRVSAVPSARGEVSLPGAAGWKISAARARPGTPAHRGARLLGRCRPARCGYRHPRRRHDTRGPLPPGRGRLHVQQPQRRSQHHDRARRAIRPVGVGVHGVVPRIRLRRSSGRRNELIPIPHPEREFVDPLATRHTRPSPGGAVSFSPPWMTTTSGISPHWRSARPVTPLRTGMDAAFSSASPIAASHSPGFLDCRPGVAQVRARRHEISGTRGASRRSLCNLGP